MKILFAIVLAHFAWSCASPPPPTVAPMQPSHPWGYHKDVVGRTDA